jgi:hypothetical protein
MTMIIISSGLDPLKATSTSTPTLVGGTVTVADPLIQATSAISPTGLGIINLGTLTVTINPGVGYTIKSSNVLDARNLSVGIIY